MVYVDTSAIVALLTLEPKTAAVTAWYASLQETPIAADWLITEFSSAISIKVRTGQLAEATAQNVRNQFGTLCDGGIKLVTVSRQAFRGASEMIADHRSGLRAGDALHLAAALELGASQIATLDATLGLNAQRNGIRSLPF